MSGMVPLARKAIIRAPRSGASTWFTLSQKSLGERLPYAARIFTHYVEMWSLPINPPLDGTHLRYAAEFGLMKFRQT